MSDSEFRRDLSPLDAVRFGDHWILVDEHFPIAGVVTDEGIVRELLHWNDARSPAGAFRTQVDPLPFGAWVSYRQDGELAFWPAGASPSSAVFVDFAGRSFSIDTGRLHFAGFDGDGVWLVDFTAVGAGHPDEPPGGQIVFRHVSVDKTIRDFELFVDRMISEIWITGLEMLIASVTRSATIDDESGTLQIEQAILDFSAGLPDRINVGEIPRPAVLHEVDDVGFLVREPPPAAPALVSTASIPLSAFEDIGWALLTTRADIEAAIDAAHEQLGDLGRYWESAATGERIPLTEGMTEIRAGLENDWPLTTMVVTFKYLEYFGGTIRARFPLFDRDGRPALGVYEAIYLMEALDTWDLPPIENAKNGILDL